MVAALVVLRGEASEADLPTDAAMRDGNTPANWNPRQRGGVVAWREACAVGRGSRRARRTAAHLAALCLKLKAFRLAGRPHHGALELPDDLKAGCGLALGWPYTRQYSAAR